MLNEPVMNIFYAIFHRFSDLHWFIQINLIASIYVFAFEFSLRILCSLIEIETFINEQPHWLFHNQMYPAGK